ncbi:uncharacterized protein LOC130508485 [Raphanus sativus]|uniref:Translation initiation factor eIF2B subunit alpha n=1 Tax=Raphanus sativus TaxID=3726 RepID=A0A9W3D827_RAPSA|nr:uncharacterized protein LOC130508485 [Raphanus sativus]
MTIPCECRRISLDKADNHTDDASPSTAHLPRRSFSIDRTSLFVFASLSTILLTLISISLTAGCDLFIRYVARTSALEYEDFNSAKSRLLERAEKFGEISCKVRYMLLYALCVPIRYEIIAKGRPDGTGVLLSNELSKLDVPVKLLLDSAVAYSMDEVDMVFVGADGVVESGDVINMMGIYQMALVAHSMNKPVYVAAESYKRKDGHEFLVAFKRSKKMSHRKPPSPRGFPETYTR